MSTIKWDEYFSRKDAELSKWMTLVDLDIRLPELLLMRMDKLVMQSGVETRVPFLDHKISGICSYSARKATFK
jgi:asparagine synthetase B (glutamine-hydrolysing)